MTNLSDPRYAPYGPSNLPRLRSSRTEFSNSGSPDLVSTVVRADPGLPFKISLAKHSSSAGAKMNTLILLIPPSEFSISASAVADSSFTRNGPLPTMWGMTQSVISLQGSSPVFLTEREGLSSSQMKATYGVSRTDSLGYNNFMGLVSVFKSNGYQHLTDSEDVFPGRRFPGQKTRVIHVLDAVLISYDGTTYFGHFTDLSFTDDASSPFSFKYSLSFTVTGIKGDFVGGHIGDGTNKDSGILIGDSSSEVAESMKLQSNSLQISRIDQRLADMGHSSSTTFPASFPKGMRQKARVDYAPEPFRTKVKNFFADLDSSDYEYSVSSTYRTLEEQRGIYGIPEGQPVPDSRHLYGMAIDIFIRKKGTKEWIGNAFTKTEPKLTSAQRQEIVAKWVQSGVPGLAAKHGLVWGGTWQEMDTVHFEDSTPMSAIWPNGQRPAGVKPIGD